jgi:hypothetical protein
MERAPYFYWASLDMTVTVISDEKELRAALAISVPEHPARHHRLRFGQEFRETAFQNQMIRLRGRSFPMDELVSQLRAALLENGWAESSLADIPERIALCIVES